MSAFVEELTQHRPTYTELIAKRAAGLDLFAWEEHLIWVVTTRRTLLTRSTVCRYCRAPLNDLTATLDHVHPRARGGEDSEANVVLACEACNKWKGMLSLQDFRKTAYFRWIKGMTLSQPVKPLSKREFRKLQGRAKREGQRLNFQIIMYTRAPLC
jgi:hypothetical protein